MKPRGPPVSTTKTKIPAFADEQPSKPTARARKYTSMAKKARVTPIPGRKVPTTKKGGAKRMSTRSSATAARTRSVTRGVAKSKKRTSK